MSGIMLSHMKELLAQCQRMMDVSDTDLLAYRQKRQEMAQTAATDSMQDAI